MRPHPRASSLGKAQPSSQRTPGYPNPAALHPRARRAPDSLPIRPHGRGAPSRESTSSRPCARRLRPHLSRRLAMNSGMETVSISTKSALPNSRLSCSAMAPAHGLRPIVDLIGAMETQSEPSELELDDVVITNPHIEAILENEDWIEDASGLMSHCIAILKICHTLTEKLVAMTMGSGAKMKTSASVSDIIVVAKRISPRVDDVVKSMYPPLDPKLLDARTTALLLSVSHLVLVTRNACHLTGGLDWIDQSLSAAEEHLEVLREAALASEPDKGLPGPEGFLQEQSAI
uniref:Transmembrane protein 98 n=1 Tax=Equus caballus TaxID=9796 RepID=A0A9L0RZR9_HORSE